VDVVTELLGGFATALSPQNLLFALIGCLLGTLIGVLPGIGPVAGVALLIPLTINLEPAGAIIMLAAIFYGTAYRGTITSVLLNTPGEAASAITTIGSSASSSTVRYATPPTWRRSACRCSPGHAPRPAPTSTVPAGSA
jgi:putative tricarboxylic transport membrane protein